jgi:peptide deformylase
MAVNEILLYPESADALRRKCELAGTVDQRVKRLIRDLKDTLEAHPEGIGLAAPQINEHLRVVVIRPGSQPTSRGQEPLLALVDPVIHEAGVEERDFDGCLSFPGLYGETVRPHYLKVAGLDERGDPFEQAFEGFDAVLVHHELDHLDGVLFIDRIARLEDLYRISEDPQGRRIRVPVSGDLSPESQRSVLGL